jgi:predicted dienelactone hydrolase
MEDLQKVREALPTEKKLSEWPIDADRVVLIGHSLGGLAVLGLAGASPTLKMGQIAAVVALAPYAGPLLTKGKVEKISVPVLLERGGGEFDFLKTDQGILFAKLAAPACDVFYDDADHFAWTDNEPHFHDATAAATMAFLDEVLAGKPATEEILASSEVDQTERCKP